jgi:hypothetical protein
MPEELKTGNAAYNAQEDIVTFIHVKEGYDMKLVPASITFPNQPSENVNYHNRREVTKC